MVVQVSKPWRGMRRSWHVANQPTGECDMAVETSQVHRTSVLVRRKIELFKGSYEDSSVIRLAN